MLLTNNIDTSLKQILTTKAIRYDAIVIGEDQNMNIFGVISVVQEATQGKIPLYIGKSVQQLRIIHHKLIKDSLRAFYLLDNKYEINATEPQGQNLIKEWHIENHVVLITSDFPCIKDVPYPVFGKIQPEF